MYIDDDTLRKQLNRILLVKTRNQIVQDIKAKGLKMHQFQLNNFLQRKDVTLSTLHKIDNYVSREIYLNNLEHTPLWAYPRAYGYRRSWVSI
jgi:hypothetical protein